MRSCATHIRQVTCFLALYQILPAILEPETMVSVQASPIDSFDHGKLQQTPVNETVETVDSLVAAVVVKTYDPLGIETFQSETLFRDGKLLGEWKECAVDNVQFEGCKIVPAYSDRLSLEYTFDRNRLDEYTLHEPTIQARTNGARAELFDFDFKDDLRFTILLRCAKRKTGSSLEVFDMTIPILKEFSITSRFAKNCTTAKHPYVRLGLIADGETQVLALPSEQLRVPPTTVTTDLFMRLSLPAESQTHGSPVVNSSNDGVGVVLRGIADEGTIVVGSDLRFSIMYSCDTNGEAVVKLVIPLPPWEDLSLNIIKKCGGRVPEMLSVGTTFDARDIIEKGVLNPAFNMSEAQVQDNGFQIGENTSLMKLYIRNEKGLHREVLHLGTMSFTVSDGSVVRVTFGNNDGMNTFAMAPGETVTKDLKFTCQKKGHANVMVSIPILQYEVVDFHINKQCRDPISYRESGIESWWTVSGVEEIGLIIFAALLVGWCIWRRGTQTKNLSRTSGYQQVVGVFI